MQAIPGRHDLLERDSLDNFAIAIEGNPFVHGNAEIAQRCAAQLEHLKQFVLRAYAGAATEQLDRRPFVDLGIPALALKQGSCEQAAIDAPMTKARRVCANRSSSFCTSS